MEKPLEFEMLFRMDNAAFDQSQGAEAARILRRIADLIEEEYTLSPGKCNIRDINGNKIGKYEIN